jgi:hypothetical protein
MRTADSAGMHKEREKDVGGRETGLQDSHPRDSVLVDLGSKPEALYFFLNKIPFPGALTQNVQELPPQGNSLNEQIKMLDAHVFSNFLQAKTKPCSHLTLCC